MRAGAWLVRWGLGACLAGCAAPDARPPVAASDPPGAASGPDAASGLPDAASGPPLAGGSGPPGDGASGGAADGRTAGGAGGERGGGGGATRYPEFPDIERVAEACGAVALGRLEAVGGAGALPAVAIEGEEALAGFLDRAAALARGTRREPVRIAVYGDSNVTADWLTGSLRRTLQARLGDGGHGFVAPGKPWPGYRHQDVSHDLDRAAWSVRSLSTRTLADGRYGFAGIAAQSRGVGARAWVETARAPAPVGRTADRIGAMFLRGPGLGRFTLRVDGGAPREVDAGADAFGAGQVVVEAPDGPHRAVVEARSRHPVRLFGFTLERHAPGVVVDSLGVAASTTATMMRQDEALFEQAVALRGHDLVILVHGSFDVTPWSTEETHAASVRTMIERLRRARPGVSVLVLSPVDYRGPLDDSRASPRRAAAEKRALARSNGAAFWDLRAAMGGDRAIDRFHARGLADPDRIHLNERGGELMGNRLALALWDALAAHVQRHPDAGCAPASP